MNIYQINYLLHGYSMAAVASAESESRALSVCGIDMSDGDIEDVKAEFIGVSRMTAAEVHAHESL